MGRRRLPRWIRRGADLKIQTFDESLKKYSGRNGFSEITNLDPTQFRAAENIDLYNGVEYDYFRARRGSARLVPDSDPIQQLGKIINKVVFPINGEEYLICAYRENPDATKIFFSSQPLLTIGNPVRIGGSTWAITGSAFLSKLALFGVTPDNSDNLKLYYTFDPSAGGDLFIYADEAKESQVGSINDLVADQTNVIVEENTSGISGTVYVGTVPIAEEDGTFDLDAVELDYSIGLIPDMKVFNNRVYAFHQKGNKIIEWNADQERMQIRDMGLFFPHIVSWDSPSAPSLMDTNAGYYYGLEKVVQVGGVDLYASTPNRKYSDGTIQLVSPVNGSARLKILKSDLVDDPNWTHIRVWRTKSLTPNFSDPLFPIDAQGVIDQLYELALITRAEMFSAFATIATGGNLPPGNAGVEAGLDSGDYYIEDFNTDAVLSILVGIDLIELVPIPGCRTGDVVNGRVFCSGVGSDNLAPNGEMIDPSIAEDVLYTTTAFSKYQEQWEPQAYLNAGRDGKKTTAIIALVEDAIVVREGMTKRIQQGNPDAGVVMVDDKIGVTTFRMIGYIPGIGLCAICSDKYFRYLGFDLAWHQTLNGTEISQSVSDYTFSEFDSQISDFVYVNGKLLMLLPSNTIMVLHVKEGKGWTNYVYGAGSGNPFDCVFIFSNNQRVASATYVKYLLELEIGTVTDDDPNNLTDDADILGSWESYGFSGKGQLIEATRYSFWGKLAGNATVTAKVSNTTWEMLPTFQDPGLFAANPEYNERQYRFEPQPTDVGVFKWVPLRGQFISFSVSTKAPAMVAWQKLEGRIRQTNGNQQASLAGGIAPQGPGWANQDLMLLNFEDPADVFYDASGKGLNHDWNANLGPIAQGPSASHFTNIQLTGWDHSTLYGARYSGSGHTWTLWLTAELRDIADPTDAVATCDTINVDGPQTLTDVNGSGIYGTFTTLNANGGDDDNLDIAYLPRGSKTNRVSQKPGKGVLISNGWMNYTPDPTTPLIGVKNLAWRVVFSIPSGGNFQSSGKVGSTAWKLYADTTGVTFQLSSPSFTWTSTVTLTAGVVYALVFTLSKALEGAFYIDSLAGSFSGKRTTVKASGSVVSGSFLAVGTFDSHLSSLSLSGVTATLFGTCVSDGETVHWRLWRTPSQRDAGSTENSVAYSQDLANGAATRTISQENSSGISGTVYTDGIYATVNGKLDAIFIPGVLTGHNITPAGTVSYYEIEKADPKEEQAKRFWGIMKAYP